MNFSRSLTFAVVIAAVGTAHAGWNRSPYAEERPVDLAASAIPGTRVISSTGLVSAKSLVESKISEGVTLAAGKSSAVIQLNGQQNIHTVAFNNDGAEGKITIAGSADNKDWSVLGSAVFSAGERVAQVYFGAATVKYINVSFDSAKGGTIRSFEVFGDSTDKDYEVQPKDAGQGGSTINLAGALGGARAIYAFPTPTSVGELNSLHNVFNFPRSRDKYRTIVYDLGSTRAVKEFSASYSQRPMRVEVFAFDGLFEKRDWRGKLLLDPSTFDSAKPVAVAEDAKGVGHITITPGKAVSASYIALRFEPDYQTELAATSSVGERGPQPESRFAKSQGIGGDLTVGAVEFLSDREYEVTPNSAGRVLENDRFLPVAFGSSAATLLRSLPGQSQNSDRNSKNNGAANTVRDMRVTTASAISAGTSIGTSAATGVGAGLGTNARPNVGTNAQASTGTSASANTGAATAPYVPGEAGSAESKLVQSFSNKFDAAGSRKNKHGRHCDHCYYCNRGGRCNHCGGHDDDHDSDHDGHDDNDHGDHGNGDHGDHGNDHEPPVTS